MKCPGQHCVAKKRSVKQALRMFMGATQGLRAKQKVGRNVTLHRWTGQASA